MDGHFPTLKNDDPNAPLDSTLSFQLTLKVHRKTGIKAEEKKKNDIGSG
jgi:hypothetical protein